MTALSLQAPRHPSPSFPKPRASDPAETPSSSTAARALATIRSPLESPYHQEPGAPGPSSRYAMPSPINARRNIAEPRAQSTNRPPMYNNYSHLDESPSTSPSRRPSSAPGGKNNSNNNASTIAFADHATTNGSDVPPARPAKPALLRSKSEYASASRADDHDFTDDEPYDWGARHGFEDHYQSEDIISQLANVRLIPRHSTPPVPCLFFSFLFSFFPLSHPFPSPPPLPHFRLPPFLPTAHLLFFSYDRGFYAYDSC